jgi:hypothetical protein
MQTRDETSYRLTTLRETQSHEQPCLQQLELTGSSSVSIEEAVSTAIAKAHETVRNIQWFPPSLKPAMWFR